MPDLKEDGIHVTPHKTASTTGKRLIIGWSDELREAVAIAKETRSVKLSPYLFCNRLGNPILMKNRGVLAAGIQCGGDLVRVYCRKPKSNRNLLNTIYAQSAQAMPQALNMHGHYWLMQTVGLQIVSTEENLNLSHLYGDVYGFE